VEGAKEERAPRFSLNKTIAILFLPFYQIWRADTWTPVTLCPQMDQDPLNCFKLPQREVKGIFFFKKKERGKGLLASQAKGVREGCHWRRYGQIHSCSYPNPNNYYPLLTLPIPTHIPNE
jgi:hypothetical protein